MSEKDIRALLDEIGSDLERKRRRGLLRPGPKAALYPMALGAAAIAAIACSAEPLLGEGGPQLRGGSGGSGGTIGNGGGPSAGGTGGTAGDQGHAGEGGSIEIPPPCGGQGGAGGGCAGGTATGGAGGDGGA